MSRSRDALSVRYDASARRILAHAARASKNGHSVTAWIASPVAEFHHIDGGGRTRHERAFTRSVYWIVRGGPISEGDPIRWSLKLTWGKEKKPSSTGKKARQVKVRLFRAEDAEVTGEPYINRT